MEEHDTAGTSIRLFHPDSTELDNLYLDCFTALKRYAFTMVNDHTTAEEMVQQVFLKVLESRKPIVIHTSVKAYLYRSVSNECLNYLRHQKVKRKFAIYKTQVAKEQTVNNADNLQVKELEEQLRTTINNLPEQCRTIFQLSRFENYKYAEIAAQLGLSVKTIETQMSRALRKLRIQLADYLPVCIWLLSTIYNTPGKY